MRCQLLVPEATALETAESRSLAMPAAADAAALDRAVVSGVPEVAMKLPTGAGSPEFATKCPKNQTWAL